MATCNNITSGIARGCRDNAPGSYEVYIATYPDTLEVTKDVTTSGTTITAINDGAGTPVDIQFYKFVPNKNTIEFTQNYTTNMENATVGVEQKITMKFAKVEASKTQQIKALAYKDALVIVADKNGNYFLAGENDGMALTAGGANITKDDNGYSLELTALEGDEADQILGTSIDLDTDGLTVHV